MIEVTVYLKNGTEIKFECEKFETTRDIVGDGFASYEVIGMKEGMSVSFKITEIVAWISKDIECKDSV